MCVIYDQYFTQGLKTAYCSYYENLPNGWILSRLDGVVNVLDHLRRPINSTERNERVKGKSEVELYPYYGATGQVGHIDEYIFDGEYILLGEDGAPFLDKNAYKAYLLDGKFWVNNHAHILETKINTKYLHYLLNAIDYGAYVSGTTRLKLTQADMNRILLPIPPLCEQQRIVKVVEYGFEILNRLDTTLN